MSRLKSTARDAQGRYTPYAAASVTGWLPYKAGVQPVQHYPINKSCWASGSRFLNVHGNAFENESPPIYTLPSGAWAFVGQTVAGDWHNPPPQSDWQVECSARIERDLAEHFGRPLTYWRRPTGPADLAATEYEHNETTRWGGLYSSCPNGRIRWADIATARLGAEEDDMNQAQEDKLDLILAWIAGDVDTAEGVQPRLARIHERVEFVPAQLVAIQQALDTLKVGAGPSAKEIAKETANETAKRMAG